MVLTRRYLVADTEVTTQQWSQWPDRPRKSEVANEGLQHPKGKVAFYDALRFCNWLSELEGLAGFYPKEVTIEWTPNFEGDGYRLPTEAEWRYACRGGAKTSYCFGDNPADLNDYAWTNANASGKPGQVAMLMPNAWGLFDMHGNLLEWCWDWYLPVPQAKGLDGKVPIDYAGPAGPDPIFRGRLVCGGSFAAGTEYAIADDRDFRGVSELQNYLGFRVVRTMPSPSGSLRTSHARSP